MKQIYRIDHMESQLNTDRLAESAAKKAKVQRERWRNQEKLMNMMINGRAAQCRKSGQNLIVEG